MADPKYAGLPGIAYDQPDIYESGDLPEADQSIGSQDENDSVEKLSCNVQESFSKFQGHWLDTTKADFSGRISFKKETGYNTWFGPYELQAQGEKETPFQKFQRLKCELAELQEEIAQNSGDASAEEMPVAVLATQLEQLQKQLVGVNIASDSRELAKKKLFSQVDQIIHMSTPSSGATPTESDNGKIKYELNYKPSQSKFEVALKANDLQKRLDSLEMLIGASEQKKSHLSAETGQKCIIDAVRSLTSKISLLEPSHIEQVESRLGLLLQKLTAINDKRTALEEADKQGKISEIYELVKKLEPLTSVLPAVVDRLLTLQGLHDEAANFHQSLVQTEVVQNQLSDTLMTHARLLKEMKEGFVDNLNTMKATIEQLENRLAAVRK